MKAKIAKIKLVRVHYIPKTLEPGILYVSEEFGAAVHLCACGCGSKVSTPLGPAEWALEDTGCGPSLRPSIGSWQLPCKSHYFINGGLILWAGQWSEEQITLGRQAEEKRRCIYYNSLERPSAGVLQKLWHWLKSLFQ